MNTTNVVEALRNETKSNKAFNAVCHIFALRERYRKQVTIAALQFKMKTEGFQYNKAEYEHILNFLGALGLGVVRRDDKQKVIGLFSLKKPLRTIGRAALGEFDELVTDEQKPPVSKTKSYMRNVYPSILTVMVGGNPINVNLAPSLSKDEVKSVIERFADSAMGFSTVVNEKTVELTITKGAGSEEIASIIKRVQGRV